MEDPYMAHNTSAVTLKAERVSANPPARYRRKAGVS